MTEREAWTLLAEYWDVAIPDGRGRCTVVGANVCLCDCITDLQAARKVNRDVALAMEAKIDREPCYGSSVYKWPINREGAKQRAAFCRAQAAKCEVTT